MGSELKVDYTPFDPIAGLPWVYAVAEEAYGANVVTTLGTVEAFDPARLNLYALPLADDPVLGVYYGRYRGSFPPAAPPNRYGVVYRAALAPAVPDLRLDLVLGGKEELLFPGRVSIPPLTGSAPPGLCAVGVYYTLSRVPVAGAVVRANLASINSAAPDEALSSQVLTAATAADGTCWIQLVQQGYFTRGDGIYRITITAPGGTVTHNIRCRIPNLPWTTFDALIPDQVP